VIESSVVDESDELPQARTRLARNRRSAGFRRQRQGRGKVLAGHLAIRAGAECRRAASRGRPDRTDAALSRSTTLDGLDLLEPWFGAVALRDGNGAIERDTRRADGARWPSAP